jgi:hypothetical protein
MDITHRRLLRYGYDLVLGGKEVAAFWKKRRKNFFDFGPAAVKPARPKVTKFFLLLFVHKK